MFLRRRENNMKTDASTLEFFGEWNDILFCESHFWQSGINNHFIDKYFDIKRKAAFFIINKKQFVFYDRSYFQQIKDQTENTDPKKLLKNLDNFYSQFKKTREFLLTKLTTDVEGLDNRELADLFMNIFTAVVEVTPYDQYSMAGESLYLEKLDDYLGKQLNKIGKEDEFVKYQTILTTPTELSSTQLEELSLLKMATKFKAGEDVDKEIKQHVNEFGWLPVFLIASDWNKDYISEQVEIKSRNINLQERLENILNFEKIQNKKVVKIMESFSEQSLWPEIFRKLVFFRNEAETMVSLGSFVLRPVYKEIYKRTGLVDLGLSYLSPKEIKNLLIDKEDFSEKINRRKKAVVLFSDMELEEIIEGDEALEIFEKIHNQKTKTTFEVNNGEKDNIQQGTPASLGRTEGLVKVINSADDLNKFEKGNILVAPSTCIDYVPIMRMAGAILTDLGGITSHAAVISRELGIPAVVGIPNVHLILKDGDMVEVDANNGIIRKI
jgi:phosphohistidine swiveling domain-containing protein